MLRVVLRSEPTTRLQQLVSRLYLTKQHPINGEWPQVFPSTSHWGGGRCSGHPKLARVDSHVDCGAVEVAESFFPTGYR